MTSLRTLAALLLTTALTANARAADPPLAEQYLHSGQFADGEAKLEKALKQNPKDDQTRFGLGLVQFVGAVEHLGQSFYRGGLTTARWGDANAPFLRMPVPPNPNPEVMTYAAQRKLLQRFVDDLAKAEATLALVQDEGVKLPIRVGEVQIDLTGEGKSRQQFHRIFAAYVNNRNLTEEMKQFKIVFDRGDVAWFRGYCHLMMGLAEFALAHDGQELFDCTAHRFYAKAKSPHPFLNEGGKGMEVVGGIHLNEILDIIAMVHLVRLPVIEPNRMKASLAHLEKVLALSRESWKYILAETDDDCEWIPNPKQTGVLRMRVTQEMVTAWLEFVTESEELLAGKKLIPFWRDAGGRGVNLRKVFTEPTKFDLVLWIQGTAATPYLEKGPVTKQETWTRLQGVFQGNFLGFAAWFN